MATTMHRLQAAISAVFHFRSMRGRLIIFPLVIFLVSILSLAFYAHWTLHQDMEQLLGEEQFSTVSFIAEEVNAEFSTRVEALKIIAEKITPAMIENPSALQTMLEDKPVYYSLFNNGIAIAGLDGTVIAEFPRLPGRLGANFKERDYIIGPLKEGKVTFGRPVMSKLMHAPAFVIGVPIRDTRGRVIGVIGGVTDLRLPSFIDKVTENRYGKTGGYVLLIPKERLIVTATDKSRIMTTLPAPGINPPLDRFLQGYEGSAVYVNPLGVEVLGSAKGVPVSGWLVGAILPTEEAFAPIHRMLFRGQLATVFITLMLVGLLWWTLRRQLAPMFDTVKTLATLSDTKTPLAIARQDELGELIGGFNRLLEILGHREEALKESEERYRTLFARATDGIFVISTEGKLLDVNESFARMHGYSTQEMLQMSLKDFDTAETSQKAPERLRRLLVGEALTFEVDHYHRDGHVFPLEVSASLVSSGGKTYIQCFHRDIADRKQAEEAERKNREETERLAEEIAIIAEIGRVVGSTLDIDEVYERLANEAKKLIFFDRFSVNLHSLHDEDIKVAYVFGEEVSGRRKGDLFPMKNSICEVLTRTRAGLLNYPKNAEINRHFLDHHAPGHMVMSSLLRVPLIYRDEVIGSLHFWSKKPDTYTEKDLRVAERIGAQIAGAIGSAKLFAEQKQAEAERQGLQERLQRAEKMEALGQLAGGVAHDLNNVLGVSTLYSELLQEQIPEESPLKKYVDNILSSTQKGAAIIDDLLTLARRGVAASNVMNISSIVSNFFKSAEFEKIQASHPRVTFRTVSREDLLNIKGSPVHLEKTLMNLVSNAAEAIGGEGEVTIRVENCYLETPIKGYDQVKQGDYVVLSVSDTGMGIPAENIGKIFEPFYTKKTMGRSGTGLGLAIVWGTVKDHNGYIDLQTEVGQGTTFTLYFPVTREETTAQKQKVPIEAYMGKGESVLVVDDIAEQQDVATRLLTRLGYAVHAVSCGEEAIGHLKENKADILVLDMIMPPGMDGLETYRRVREINPKQKAILVSGFSETDRVKEAQQLGAGAYVKKPYVMEKIGIAIRNELGKNS